jgi:hypothetical protein
VDKIYLVYDRVLCRSLVYRITNHAYHKRPGKGGDQIKDFQLFKKGTTRWTKLLSTILGYYSYTSSVPFVVLVRLKCYLESKENRKICEFLDCAISVRCPGPLLVTRGNNQNV